MQSFRLLLSKFSSGTTAPINSGLVLSGDYWVYTQSLGGGLTNDFNVRAYINDQANQQVVTDFISFLNQNTIPAEFRKIYYDDQKLSFVFNQFWTQTVVSGNLTATAFIDQALENTISIVVTNNDFVWNLASEPLRPMSGMPGQVDGVVRFGTQQDELASIYPRDDSYYIPVQLNLTSGQISRNKYELCNTPLNIHMDYEQVSAYGLSAQTSNPTQPHYVNTLLNCFVDTNLQLNENFPYLVAQTPNVSFMSRNAAIAPEGSSLIVKVVLSEPSTTGTEECQVVFVNQEAGLQDVADLFPMTLTWEIGEQVKTFEVPLLEDFFVEETESFNLAISGFINCSPGSIIEKNLRIENTTVFPEVGFIPNTGAIVETEGVVTPLMKYQLIEGDNIQLAISLNTPSVLGNEAVIVRFYRDGGIGRYGEFVSETTVSWSIGETVKEIPFNTSADLILESTELYRAVIAQKTNVVSSPVNFQTTLIYVADNSTTVRRRYSSLVFADIYRQKGKISSGFYSTQFRTIANNANVNEITNAWMVKFGTHYVDETSNQNNGYAGANNPTYPNYFYGQEGEVSIVVTNTSLYDTVFGGVVYSSGAQFEVPVTSNNFVLSLPSNAGLVAANESAQAIYTESHYRIGIKIKPPQYSGPNGEVFSPHGFTLKNGTGPEQNVLDLGEHVLPNHENLFLSLANPLHIFSTYNNILTRYDGNSCSLSFAGNLTTLRVKGVVLLDRFQNNCSYDGFGFGPSSLYTEMCQSTAGAEAGNAWFSPGLNVV